MQKLAFGYFAKGINLNFTYFPTKIHMFHVKCYLCTMSKQKFLELCCILSCYCIKLNFMPFACLLSKTIYFVAFSFQNVKIYVMCNVGCSCSTPNVFCFKELPFGLCGVSLKAMFFCFALNWRIFCMYHVFCWYSYFMPTCIKIDYCQFFMALYKICCNILK